MKGIKMRIITKVKRKLSFEARTIKFINDYKKFMESYSTKLKNETIQKAEFLRAIIRIKSSLVALQNNKTSYKKTKNKVYKKLIKESIRNIRKNKRLMKAIIEQNYNYYQYVFVGSLTR